MLDLMAYVILPVYTVLFAHGYNWITENFTVLANWFDRKAAFVGWALLVGIYFAVALGRLIQWLRAGRWAKVLLVLDLASLAVAVCLPYLPKEFPSEAELHVGFSFLTAILLGVQLLWITGRFCYLRKGGWIRYYGVLAVICLLGVILVRSIGHVSSLVEVFFSIATVLFSHRLYRCMAAEVTKKRNDS